MKHLAILLALASLAVVACTTKVVLVSPSQTPEATASPSHPEATVTSGASPFVPFATVVPSVIAPRSSPAPRTIWSFCQEMGTSTDALTGSLPYPFVNDTNYEFRCYQGKVLECRAGITGGACMKLYTGTDEPLGLAAYCAQNPNQYPPNALQAVYGDGPNVYLWRCSGTNPVMYTDPNYNPADYDDLGFVKSAWEIVTAPNNP